MAVRAYSRRVAQIRQRRWEDHDDARARLGRDRDGAHTLELVMARYGDYALYRRNGGRMGSSLSHDDAVTMSFATVRASLEEVVEYVVREVRVRAGFAELVGEHRPLVLWSGCHELIEPVLAREGVRVDLIANRVEVTHDHLAGSGVPHERFETLSDVACALADCGAAR